MDGETPATPPLETPEAPVGGDRIDRLEQRMGEFETAQADLIAAQRANTDAMSQVSSNLATLNERLAQPQPAPTPGTSATPQEPPAAVQSQPVTPAPQPSDRAEPGRRRRYS